MSTTNIPLNESILVNSTAALGTWQNGSLATQLLGNAEFFDNSVYTMTNGTAYPRLDIFEDNLASITFNVTDSIFPAVFPIAENLLDNGMYRTPILCSYPVSGQYDPLGRFLFYILILTSLIFRKHYWLATASLGSAMTYSGTAAIHMLILTAKFKFHEVGSNYAPDTSQPYGDIDVYGIYPILAAAAVMIAPILNWSITIRTSRAQPVVLCWALLILVALVPAWIHFFGGSSNLWFLNVATSVALCPVSATNSSTYCGPGMDLTYDTYNACQCYDLCATFSPTTPLRRGANMQPWLLNNIPSRTLQNPIGAQTVFDVLQVNRFAIAFIVVQGFFGLLQSQFTQTEFRNLTFRILYLGPKELVALLLKGERQRRWLRRLRLAGPDINKRTLIWRCRKHFAKIFATALFMFSILCLALCPAVLITAAITNELFVGSFPVSEHSDAVGAWNSWAVTCLVLFATLLVRYRDAWSVSITVALYRFWHFLAYDSDERPQFASVDQDSSDESSKSTTASTNGSRAFFIGLTGPFIHTWHTVSKAKYRVFIELSMFLEWWRDPEGQSRRSWQDTMNDTERRMSVFPKCSCHFCKNDPDSFQSTSSYIPTWGQRLINGRDITYSENKAGGRKPTFVVTKPAVFDTI